MSLWVAVPAALGAAVTYGAATAVQHSAASSTGGSGTRGLLGLLRDRRWLMSVGGDAAGLVLQVLALATGPVVLIQPLLVLALPVALPVGWALGGPRPDRRDAAAVAGIVVALAVFFVLVGDPGPSSAAAVPSLVLTTAAGLVLVGAVLSVSLGRPAVRRRAPRAVLLGVVAGGGFGYVGVLINAAADAFARDRWTGLLTGPGAAAVVGTVLVGAAATVATQLSFQLGELSSSFPANEAAAPVAAVVLGAALLHEDEPTGVLHLLGYALCLLAVIAATVRLAGRPLASPQLGAHAGNDRRAE